MQWFSLKKMILRQIDRIINQVMKIKRAEAQT